MNENNEKKKEKEQNENNESDLIMIISSEEKEIPEKRPPFKDIIFDYIPESQSKVTALKDDY
ncbi:MAG: hypothetical protein ACTSVI_13905 [Promethearchaeota archaeon]